MGTSYRNVGGLFFMLIFTPYFFPLLPILEPMFKVQHFSHNGIKLKER